MSQRNRHGKAASKRDKRGARRARAPAARPSNRLTRGVLKNGAVIVVVSAVLAIGTVFTLPAWISRAAATAANERSLPLFDSIQVTAGLPTPTAGTRVPVNSIDRFSGNPILANSPTVTYKGYVVAFCCRKSAGYTGGWDHLTDAEKDTYIRGFLK